MNIKTRQDAREEIEQAIEDRGPYSHNIISCVLRLIASRWGYKETNDFIDEYDLTRRFGIAKRKEEARNI